MTETIGEGTGLARIEERQAEVTVAAETLVVRDADTYLSAKRIRQGIAAMVDEIRATFRPIIKAAHAAWQEALGKEAAHLRPWQDADARLKGKITAWLVEEDGRRREAEAARLKAEEEKKRIQDEAIAKAVAADQAGKRLEANKILDQAAKKEMEIRIPPPPPKKAPDEVHLRATWKARIVDEAKVPREFCVSDMAKINAYLHSFLDNPAPIPGVEFYVEHTSVTRKTG